MWSLGGPPTLKALNPKAETPKNPKLKTPNPKPYTLYPKPRTPVEAERDGLNTSHCRLHVGGF